MEQHKSQKQVCNQNDQTLNSSSNKENAFQSSLQSQKRNNILANRYVLAQNSNFHGSFDQLSVAEASDIVGPSSSSRRPRRKRSRAVQRSSDESSSQGL